ncbi:hypothetical protein [Clostridium intestinale]|uniref:CotS family spore coat protein n=1 Tax=Clostridium intestinale TaxID=36845 RepID=A0A7D6VSW8_9CLOT|nr:hypothetical protein [Clostridium intestinale]QLY82056.1 hypothetical protein HZF06_10855 [Clostridium intestinale]
MEDYSKILSNYNIEGYSLSFIDNNYIVDCKTEMFMLHSYRSKKTQLKDFLQFYEDLYNNGFRKIGKIIKTNNGNKYIKARDTSYFLTSYFREDTDFVYNIDFFRNSILLLNKFHRCTIELHPEKYNFKREYTKYIKRYLKRIEYMLNLKNTISNNIIKSYFDNQVLDILVSYDEVLNNCKKIFNNLCTIKNKTPHRYKFSTSGITIDSFTKSDNKIKLKNINRIKYSYYHMDIGSLLNSILNQPSVNWDYQTFNDLIEVYKKNYNFSLEDIYLILGFTAFPYKFYDICRDIYKKHSHKNISEYKLELNNILSQGENVNTWFKFYVEATDI